MFPRHKLTAQILPVMEPFKGQVLTEDNCPRRGENKPASTELATTGSRGHKAGAQGPV